MYILMFDQVMDLVVGMSRFSKKRKRNSPNLAVHLIKQGKYEDARKVADAHKILLNLMEMIELSEGDNNGSKTC